MSESGPKGPTVPTCVFKNPGGIDDAIDTTILTAIGARFDACSNVRVPSRTSDCERELRIVCKVSSRVTRATVQ